MQTRIYSTEELSKLHKIEIDIIKEINRICKKHDLTYFSVGGTTLGAIRHQGFIPWDDDIDIGFLREDYEKFLRIAQDELKEGYTLQYFSVDKNSPNYFAKIRKDGTRFVIECVEGLNIHHGISVDIMPYDKVPTDIKILKKYRKKVTFWIRLYAIKSLKIKWQFNQGVKKTFNCFVKKLTKLCLFFVSKRTIFNHLDKEMKKYNHLDTNCISSRGRECFECTKEDIFPPVLLPFEDIQLPVPNNAEKLLEKQYGDYMKLPPEEKRIGHAPILLEFEEKGEEK